MQIFLELASEHPNSIEQKGTFFDKLFPIFDQTTKLLVEKRISIETIGHSKRKVGKKVGKVCRVYNKGVKSSDFPQFPTI